MYRIFLLSLVGLSLSACEGFFGTKTPTDFLDEPVFDDRTVAYVPIQPVWDDGLVFPVDIIAGWDELIYVADQGTEEIIAYDQIGQELGRFTVPGLKAIAQDRTLDILATGTRDTSINGEAFTLPAIYRIDLNKQGNYGLQNARIENVLIHPFYFKLSTPTAAEEAVSFESIAVLADNRYYVARSGPSNNPNQFGGPDQAVLLFTATDEFQSPIFVNTNLGLFRNYFKSPVSITTLAQPPQSPAVNGLGDFYFSSVDPSTVLKVQLIDVTEDDNGISYDVANLLSGDTSKAERFLYEPDHFTEPADLTFSGDGTNYLFVVDAKRDSLYQFNSLGFEGAMPPAGSRSNKVILTSFGGTGIGLTQFQEPRGVAYLDEIVYVADAGNARILRFKLTTDFN